MTQITKLIDKERDNLNIFISIKYTEFAKGEKSSHQGISSEDNFTGELYQAIKEEIYQLYKNSSRK